MTQSLAHSAWLDENSTQTLSKGRVALHAILTAMEIGPEHDVLLPAFTCVVVPAAVTYRQARPVFYDADLSCWDSTPSEILRRLTPRTRAVIVQHSFGIPFDVPALRQRLPDNVYLIEDCAHTLTATVHGQPVGSMGHAAFTSAQWNKPTPVGLGGIARANTPSLARALAKTVQTHYRPPRATYATSLALLRVARTLFANPRAFWFAQDTYRRATELGIVKGSSDPSELTTVDPPRDYFMQMDTLSKRLLRKRISRLDEADRHQRAIAAFYFEYLRPLGYCAPSAPPTAECTWLRFPILVRDRARLLDHARAKRIELGDWFNAPLHPRNARRELFGYRPGQAPTTEAIARHVVNLPTHRQITFERAREIARCVTECADPISTEEL